MSRRAHGRGGGGIVSPIVPPSPPLATEVVPSSGLFEEERVAETDLASERVTPEEPDDEDTETHPIVAAPPAPPERQLPAVGTELRCSNFEGGLAVLGIVREVGDASVLLWLPALERRWPILLERIDGKAWQHRASDYPKRGEDERFDAEFRPALAVKASASGDFVSPRAARAKHVWAMTTDSVVAHGYDAAGEPCKNWSPQQRGEFRKTAVDSAPQVFRLL